MAGELSGKAALVTGAASGIGREIARRFAAAGARVLVADLNGAGAAEVATAIGGGARSFAVDVRDEEQQRLMVEAARDLGGGKLDIAVNNAGYGAFAPITEMDVAAWRDVVDVVLTGVFIGIKHEGRVLTAGGSIINIASLNAIQPAEGMSAYCSAKAAVAMLTQVASMELGPKGVRVNAIAPGLIETPATGAFFALPALRDAFVEETSLKRYGLPADVADTALYLASDQSRWMTGQLLHLDGGASQRKYPPLFSFAQQMAALAEQS
jgi:3-oxoacyl-[acyl-carrier protein] reductase